MEMGEDISDDPSSDLADLRTMVLDLKRQLTAFTASDRSEPSPRGYTPRADKPGRRMKTRNGISAYAFAEEIENAVLAARFQHAIDHDDAEEFDALCVLAGGKPDIVADISACSFCEEGGEALVYAIKEYTDLARHVDTDTLNINTFTADVPTASAAPIAAAPPPPPFNGMPSDTEDGAMPTAIPPRRQARYRQLRHGFDRYGVVPLPPERQDPDPPIPASPPYSPPVLVGLSTETLPLMERTKGNLRL
ncbi:hypothetical protein CYMTET_52530 [Cymbomonas tetramitiformis]|uniref:Uncharacterized protein n=1 Tax=Cymbomonas tetramitiformis TaxID=36881 RepID=A0AAE0BK57_9CHLO|nr:hypothetical protein CYMTET_52530 [Cymbomonas tetramitiformis]